MGGEWLQASGCNEDDAEAVMERTHLRRGKERSGSRAWRGKGGERGRESMDLS